MSEVDYQFTPIPTHLYMCLDTNCRSVLFTLIQLSSMFAGKDGWFFRSNADMEAQCRLSRKVLEGALDALLKCNLIDFIPQPQAKGANQTSKYYKVMFEKFQIFEQVRLEELMKNPEFQINTSDYKHETFVWKTKEAAGKPASQTLAAPMSAQSTHNIDSINNRNNKENKNN